MAGSPVITKTISHLLTLILPVQCPSCSRVCDSLYTQPFCLSCWGSIKQYQGNICSRCGCPTISPVSSCQECIKREIYFDALTFYGLFEDVLYEAIHRLKFYKVSSLAKPLAHLILTKINNDFDYVVPVALTKNHLFERGFNQSALIAKVIANKLSKPLLLDTLVKIKDTTPQSLLDKAKRLKNPVGAYALKIPELITNKKVLLVDDVVTTASTVNECAKVLKTEGKASNVYVACLAHAVPFQIT